MMGMSSVSCEGLYAEVKESLSGAGHKGASDFNGWDFMKGVAVAVLLGAAGTLVAGCVGKDEPLKFEQQYRFDRFGDTKTIHDQSTDKTYEFELNGLDKVHTYVNNHRLAHFAVYDVGDKGRLKIGDVAISDVDGNDITLPGTRMKLDVDVGDGYVDLEIEQ